jgi:IS5 family transposase
VRDQPGFFDVDDRLKRLSDLGDQLEEFRAAVDFEMFRPDPDVALAYSDGAQGGRPSFDPVTILKALVIQTNNLSDERAEFLINDRLSFMRFLGLGLSGRITDARTIWLFREKLTKAGAIRPLFERFDATLRQSGYIAMSGRIVDASLIAAPRPRNANNAKEEMGRPGRVPDNLEGQASETTPEGSRRALDGQVHQVQAARGCLTPPVDLAIPVFSVSVVCIPRVVMPLAAERWGSRPMA